MGKFSNSLTRQFNRTFGVSAEQGGRQFGYDQQQEAELLKEQAKIDAEAQDEKEKQDWIRGLLPDRDLVYKTPAHPNFKGDIKNWEKSSDGQWVEKNRGMNLPGKPKPDYLLKGLKWFTPSQLKNLDGIVNPSAEEQKLPTITQSDYKPVEEVDKDLAKKYPGYVVKVTTKKKGEQVISETYGSPISRERTSTKTGYGTEYVGLSDYEKSIAKSIDKEWVHNNSAKRVGARYGEALFEYTDDDGLKWTETLPYETTTKTTKGGRAYEVMGIKERVDQIRRRQVATIEQLLGDDKLGVYREIQGKYDLENLSDVEFVKSAEEFKDKVRQAYLKKEIDEGDFTLYKKLIERTFDMSYDAIR